MMWRPGQTGTGSPMDVPIKGGMVDRTVNTRQLPLITVRLFFWIASTFGVGIPSDEAILAVAGEEPPDVIEPDFKTSVDDTEWRG